MLKYYTGIGSRETNENILCLMEDLSFALSQQGWILRSGGADGADTAFEVGASNPFSEVVPEIYLPWITFNNHDSMSKGVLVPSAYNNWTEAQGMASEIHPAWDRLSPAVKTLHSRNMYQVLGKDLKTPSKFLVCYAKPSKDGYVVGGTRSAYKLAKDRGIPCFNLFNEEDYDRICKWLY